MLLGTDRTLAPATGLSVFVLFSSVRSTLAALRRAAALASRLEARITVLATQVVPYPRPLTSPPVPAEFAAGKLRCVSSQSPVEVKIHLLLCRDRWEALALVLRPHSLVVLGGRRRWWPNGERRLARRLRRAGHEVVFIEAE